MTNRGVLRCDDRDGDEDTPEWKAIDDALHENHEAWEVCPECGMKGVITYPLHHEINWDGIVVITPKAKRCHGYYDEDSDHPFAGDDCGWTREVA